VVVLHEKHRRRAKVSPVDRDDLGSGGALQHGFIVTAEHNGRPVEGAGNFDRFGGLEDFSADRRQQIPVDLIAIGDDGVGLKTETAP
jgi:hypothetical protein